MAYSKERFALHLSEARISGIIDSSFVDGPGNRTVVFFQGCNFKCVYCHNPETISMLGGELADLDRILDRIKSNMPFIDGITASGGECALQAMFLTELFYETKRLGLTNFIDTNGSVPFKDYPELVRLTDGFMLDVKASDPIEHVNITGKDNTIVLANVSFLAIQRKLYEIRTVNAGGLTDTENTIRDIARILPKNNAVREIRLKIIRFSPKGVIDEFKSLIVPSEEDMLRLKLMAVENGFNDVLVV